MTSSNVNILRVTDLLYGEFIDQRWIPHTKARDAELYNEDAGDLRCHRAHHDVIVMNGWIWQTQKTMWIASARRQCDIQLLSAESFRSWWRHQMETFSALLVICAGNSPVPGEFPSQRPVIRSFGFFFDLSLNKRFSKQSWGWWFGVPSHPLWRHCNVRSWWQEARMSRNYDIKQTIADSHAGYQPWLSIVASDFNKLQPSDIWFTELTIRRQAINWTNADVFNFT